MTITATGEVRDADGNLLNVEPIETTVTVTEEQAAAIAARLEETE